MKEVLLEYGDGKMPVQLPDSAVVVRYGETYRDPLPAPDPVEVTRQALARPLGMKPLRELAKPGDKVAIAFPDRVKGGFHQQSHRRISIPLMLEELRSAGVKDRDITLVCAPGLHRKNTVQELYTYMDHQVLREFLPDRVVMHDCEDRENVAEIGYTEHGDWVEMNRQVYEADIAIQVGHCLGNPYGGYSGGYKMCATGLSGWRSIRTYHCPADMHGDDFLPANHDRSMMRKQFDAVGKKMEEGMGKRFFTVDAVLDSNARIIGVFAGRADLVQEESWKVADKRTDVRLDLPKKADILLFGLPRSFHYGPGMGTNPILMLQAIGGQLVRDYDIFQEGGVIIAPSICDGWFNEEWFPSYREVWEKLWEVSDFAELPRFEEEVCSDPEYVRKFRFGYAYHAFHAFSMVSMGAIVHKRASACFIPGAREPGYARSMGCLPTSTVEEALEKAKRYVGADPLIVALPENFLRAAVHLKMRE